MSRQSQHTVEMELCRNIELLRKRLRRTTGRMSQHINLLSRHNEELPEKNICRDQGFYVTTYNSSVNTARHERNVMTEDTYVAISTR